MHTNEATAKQKSFLQDLARRLDQFGDEKLAAIIRSKLDTPVLSSEATVMIEGCLLRLSELKTKTTFRELAA